MHLFPKRSFEIVLVFLFTVNGIADPETQNSEKNSKASKNETVIASDLENFSFSFAFVNDNYSAKWKNGYAENYLGADDFFTSSYVIRFYWHDWRISVNNNNVTSRLFNYRYDLIDLKLAKNFYYKTFSIRPELGLLWKGNFGGEGIQNSWHELRAIREVDLPYSRERGTALSAGTLISNSFGELFFSSDHLAAQLEVQYFSDFKASRITPLFNYQMNIWHEKFWTELLFGTRIYLNRINQYSEMVESGVISAIGFKYRLTDNFFIDSGISFQSSRNLKEDPSYGDREFNYLPQYWLAISFKSAWKSLYEYLDY